MKSLLFLLTLVLLFSCNKEDNSEYSTLLSKETKYRQTTDTPIITYWEYYNDKRVKSKSVTFDDHIQYKTTYHYDLDTSRAYYFYGDDLARLYKSYPLNDSIGKIEVYENTTQNFTSYYLQEYNGAACSLINSDFHHADNDQLITHSEYSYLNENCSSVESNFYQGELTNTHTTIRDSKNHYASSTKVNNGLFQVHHGLWIDSEALDKGNALLRTNKFSETYSDSTIYSYTYNRDNYPISMQIIYRWMGFPDDTVYTEFEYSMY